MIGIIQIYNKNIHRMSENKHSKSYMYFGLKVG